MSIDWKKVAKSKRIDHLFSIKAVKDCMALMKKLNMVIHKQHMEIVKNKEYIEDLEERLWRFQITIYDDSLRKMTLKTKPGKGVNENEISGPNLAAILGIHENSVYRFKNKGNSVSDMVDWAIQRDRMFLVRRHAKEFEDYKMDVNSKKPRLNMKAIP